MLKGLKMLRELMESSDRVTVSGSMYNYYGSGYASAAAGTTLSLRVRVFPCAY